MLARRLLVLAAAVLPLVACGGSGGDDATLASGSSAPPSSTATDGSTAPASHDTACDLVSLDHVKNAIGADASVQSSFPEYCKWQTGDGARSVEVNITTTAQMGVPTLESYLSLESAASLQPTAAPEHAFFDAKFSTIDFTKGDAFVYMQIKLDSSSQDAKVSSKDDELAALQPLAVEAFANL